jgi:hypothetical protein
VVVEIANHRFAKRRFRDLPHGLHGDDPAWVPRLADHPSRTRPRRDGWFAAGGQVAMLLARRAGEIVPVGRCTAHFLEDDRADGWFGFLDTIDDEEQGPDVVAALLKVAARLLRVEESTTMTGPASYSVSEEAGAMVSGFDAPEVTGRPRTPRWLPAALEAAGLQGVEERSTWRLPAVGVDRVGASPDPALMRLVPAGVRAYADRRLLLSVPEVGSVVAVPDLAGATRAADKAWDLARRARERDWEGCVVLGMEGDPSVLVPAIQAAAGAAGYEWVVAPWAPLGAGPPETVHRLYRMDLTPG